MLGHDSLNPIAGSRRTSTPRWRPSSCPTTATGSASAPRSSAPPATTTPTTARPTGFDTIFDNPNFAGGEFSYWQRQQIRLFGVNLVNRMSLVPDLRSSKIQGQTNFVNPGLLLFNFGIDADITPKLKLISNVNFLWFDQTDVLEQFVFQSDIANFIGTDLSMGLEYRPLLNNNIIIVGGVSGLLPGNGFDDLYNPLIGEVDALVAGVHGNCV